MDKLGTKDDRIFWQSLKLCPSCHKRRLYGDEKQCVECRAYHANWNARYYKQNREAMISDMRVRNKGRYQKRKELGLCTKCGSKFLKPGTTKCYRCLAKDAEVSRRYHHKKRDEVAAYG